jgi:hypothetical protein
MLLSLGDASLAVSCLAGVVGVADTIGVGAGASVDVEVYAGAETRTKPASNYKEPGVMFVVPIED